MPGPLEKDNRTVFVRGISFDVDEKPLEEAFSEIGPVKQCFIVREKGAKKHKGFGFVQFAIPEDAERAVEELNNKQVAGRKLLVCCPCKHVSQYDHVDHFYAWT